MRRTPPAVNPTSNPRWPWALLVLAMVGAAWLRVPLVLNAAAHLDSDLAVDGLTLADAVRGHWRWHYPGTPQMGIGPVLLSWPQAAWWGANPITLVSGGLVAAEALILATFLLAWRGFGPGVAAWGLVPLTFASSGTIWLSGRLTGGHLLTTAWHALAFALLHDVLASGGLRRSAILGLWSGLGLYLDAMFALTVAALVPAGLMAWWVSGRSKRGFRGALVFLATAILGFLPHEIGVRVDPHDAYHEQLEPIFQPAVLAEHARILGLECLPRLIAGHRLPGLQADESEPRQADRDPSPIPLGVTILTLSVFVASILAIVVARPTRDDPAREAVRWGLLASTLLVIAGFIANRNIFNSDNYRYLVFLLVPWSLGFGLAMRALARRGGGGLAASVTLTLVFAVLMTLDVGRWYDRRGWIDADGLPRREKVDDPALAWLDSHPEVRHVSGDYWEVYRIAFLTGGRVMGVPFPGYPVRFPEWSRHRPQVVIGRWTEAGEPYRRRAIRRGGMRLLSTRDVWIYSWP